VIEKPYFHRTYAEDSCLDSFATWNFWEENFSISILSQP